MAISVKFEEEKTHYKFLYSEKQDHKCVSNILAFVNSIISHRIHIIVDVVVMFYSGSSSSNNNNNTDADSAIKNDYLSTLTASILIPCMTRNWTNISIEIELFNHFSFVLFSIKTIRSM